jgi:hypothetical protein
VPRQNSGIRQNSIRAEIARFPGMSLGRKSRGSEQGISEGKLISGARGGSVSMPLLCCHVATQFQPRFVQWWSFMYMSGSSIVAVVQATQPRTSNHGTLIS